MFEAPRKDQQAWFINRFGPEVNLANVAVDETLGLEALRLGLRADTLGPVARLPRLPRLPGLPDVGRLTASEQP